MSTYFECRFNKLKLDLTERPDILQWIEDCKCIRDEIKQGIYKNSTPKPPAEIPDNSKCVQLFYNSFDGVNSYDNELYLNINNPDSVIIDYTLGNKNTNNDIFQIVALLSKYCVSGNIILWDEYNHHVFDIEKIKHSNLNPIVIDKDFDSNDYYSVSGKEGYDLFYEDLLYEDYIKELFKK